MISPVRTKIANKIPVFIISGKSPLEASGGGYSSFAYNLAKILKSSGCEIYILALGSETRTVSTKVGKILLFKSKIPFINVNIYALPGLPIYSLIFMNGIKRILSKKGYGKSIVWGIGPWGLVGAYLKLFSNEKIIYLNSYFTTIRHEWWGGVRSLKTKDYGIWPKLKYLAIYYSAVQYLALLEKFALKYCDKILTNYHSTEKILKKEFNISPHRFFRMHSYTKTYSRDAANAKKPENITIPPKFIFYFSRHDPRKGVNFLIRAMRILKNEGIKIPLLIAGRGDMLKANQNLSIKLKLGDSVKFLGFVNNTSMLMEKCSMFVFPSIEEGSSSLVIQEAMEMEAPIIASDCDGIGEDIEDGKSGILVPPGNPHSLAIAIKRLIDDSMFASRLGKNARKSYIKKFNTGLVRKDIKKLLLSL